MKTRRMSESNSANSLAASEKFVKLIEFKKSIILDEDALDNVAISIYNVLMTNVDVNGTCVQPKEITTLVNKFPTWAVIRIVVSVQNTLLTEGLESKLEEFSAFLDHFAYSTRKN